MYGFKIKKLGIKNDNGFDFEAKLGNKDSNYRLSQDLFVIPDKDNFILYEPKVPSVLSVNKAAVKALQAFHKGDQNLDQNSSFVEKLIAARILITHKKSPQREIFLNDQADFDPEGVSLFLTTNCSMHCIYCYSNGGDNPKQMPWKTAKAAIDWIIDHIRKRGKSKLYISFHGGGEVTTAINLMKKCVEYVRQQTAPHKITARIESGLNGVMNRHTMHWITQNLDGATVSLDGLPEVQNFQRPLANGEDSFPLVSTTLKHMDAKGFKYSIRMTITQKYLEKLADSVQFIAKNFKAKVIQIEPLFLVGRARKNELTQVDSMMFVEEYRNALKQAVNYGKNLKYSGARRHITTNSFCKASTGNSFAVTPDGMVTSCYEVADLDDSRSSLFIFGKFDHRSGQFFFDKEKIQKLRTLSVENKPYCDKCFCKWHCAGDCPAKLALFGDAWDPSSNPRCYINRELTKDQIKEFLL